MKFYIALLLTTFSSAALAAPPPAQGCPPPPQAFADCKGKKAGDTVQHLTPAGQKIAAICTLSPQGLFADISPCGMPLPHAPPPSAFVDCKGKKPGAVVQHRTPSGEKVAATCTDSPQGLFARPAHPPR